MKILLSKAGKKFYREWIFRDLTHAIESGSHTVILGPNGSGKSTLLQMLSGIISPTEGSIQFFSGEKKIDIEEVFMNVSLAAPYLELIEEFTLSEIISFHFSFKKAVAGISAEEVLSLSGLENHGEKVYKYFSSGMKQRVKLSLAVLSDVPVLLLDEPCGNLDGDAVRWYRDMIEKFALQKTIIVASNNQKDEFSFCTSQIITDDYRR